MTSLTFTKMQGLGNDFMVINAINHPFSLSAKAISALADRHFGIGFDQLLVVAPAPANSSAIDFSYRIFNADGGEVSQCGNGARCFARYVRDKGLIDRDEIHVATASGQLTLYLLENGDVKVNMGVPDFNPEKIPFKAPLRQPAYHLTLPDHPAPLSIGAVSMGNPHLVYRVADIDSAPVATLGPALVAHRDFPEGVNVGFLQVVDAHTLRLRVYERGSGETLACGSGACAAAVMAQQWGVTSGSCVVQLRGGQLTIDWAGEGTPVWMSGPATTVFEGHINLSDIPILTSESAQ
ncbi:MAG: diaminopimelate epimerase [Gammaproteobacteria bacterium]|nr:diaminopimelate epimerase [Gammaproteobacteria bacterium]